MAIPIGPELLGGKPEIKDDHPITMRVSSTVSTGVLQFFPIDD